MYTITKLVILHYIDRQTGGGGGYKKVRAIIIFQLTCKYTLLWGTKLSYLEKLALKFVFQLVFFTHFYPQYLN